MLRTLQFASAACLLFAVSTACAQITDPNALVAPPPRNPAERRGHLLNAHPQASGPGDVEWLRPYAQPAPAGNKAALLLDTRFRELLMEDLRAPQSMWSQGLPLADAAQQFLSGPGAVESSGNRYITVTGCITDPDTHACSQRGLLWVDPAVRTPLVAFSALRWTEQQRTTAQPGAPFNLWIFTSQALDPAHLPVSLTTALTHFVAAACPTPSIANVLLVDPNGVPRILGSLAAGITPAPCQLKQGMPHE